MVYTRRPAAAAAQAQQANNSTPAYTTMATRNSPQAGQFTPAQQYGNNVSAPAANYQQSYNTTSYQTQTFTPSPAKPAVTPQAQAQPVQAQPVQQPVKAEEAANDTPMETSEDGKPRYPGRRDRLPGFKYKPNKRIKRIKRNDTLRRVIKPKNSIMCLHELITGLQFNIQELAPGHDNIQRFSVTVNAFGKSYEGVGISKLQAKQVACENALKGILIDRMVKQAQREAEGLPINEEADDPDDKSSIPEDTIPWVNVASFALHKLFSEWQAQGTTIPIDGLCGAGPNATGPKPKVAINKPMPENPTFYQPTMLLHIVRPAVTFTDSSNIVSGVPPEFTATCVCDGKTYTGIGTKKKVARRNCAKAALADMGVTYPENS